MTAAAAGKTKSPTEKPVARLKLHRKPAHIHADDHFQPRPSTLRFWRRARAAATIRSSDQARIIDRSLHARHCSCNSRSARSAVRWAWRLADQGGTRWARTRPHTLRIFTTNAHLRVNPKILWVALGRSASTLAIHATRLDAPGSFSAHYPAAIGGGQFPSYVAVPLTETLVSEYGASGPALQAAMFARNKMPDAQAVAAFAERAREIWPV
jgi:hypothetical protein